MSIDYNQGETAVSIPNYYVYTKVAWTDDWTLQEHLVPLTQQVGANQQSVARFLYQTGRIWREGAEVVADIAPVDLTVSFIMLEVFVRAVDGSDGALLHRWIGVVDQDDRDIIGVNEDESSAINQVYTAFGLERLLDSRVVRGSWIMSKNPKAGSDIIACHIATPLIFNAPGWGTTTGEKNRHYQGAEFLFNRTITDGKESVFNPWADVREDHPSAFGLLTDDAEGTDKDKVWNLGEVLGYLIAFFGPILNGVGTPGSVGFRLNTLERYAEKEPAEATLIDALFGNGTDPAMAEVYGFNPEGKTLFECLNELCSPSRGLGWTMVYPDNTRDHTKGPLIALFTINNTAITVGDATLPATPLQASLQVTHRQDLMYTFTKTTVHNYGKITVQGERILSCFSVSGADGSLDKGWTSEEETQYTTPTGLTLPADYDKVKELRSRSRVWREYIVKKDWNFKAKNGENSGAGMIVNPVCGDDGTLVETAASLSRRDKRFEDFIPITAPLPEGATVPPEPVYMAPRAFAKFKGRDTIWIDLVNNAITEAPTARLRMLDDRFGVEVACNPNDRISSGNFDNTGGFQTINWSTELILTLAMRCDARLSYTITTSGDPFRELIIDVPNAELWLIAEGTVYDIDKDGALKRKVSGDRIARNDIAKLKQVGAMAKAWYATPRRSAKLMFQSLTYQLPDADEDVTEPQSLHIGLLVKSVFEVSDSAPLNTPIWSRSIDFIANTTVYETLSPVTPDFALGKGRRRAAHYHHQAHHAAHRRRKP